jgi:hypothetical protein
MTTDKKLIIGAVVVLVLIGVFDAMGEYSQARRPAYGTDNDGRDNVVCTMEAKQCPDGSYVGRTGPRCEFSPCPVSTSSISTTTDTTERPGGPLLTGGLVGQVMLGPTCPVVQYPPDPKCDDKPYKTTVVVTVSGTNKEVGRQVTDDNGYFMFAFLPGKYDVTAVGGSTLPRCSTATVTLTKAETSQADISCDTGIR